MNFIDGLYTAADNKGIPTTQIGPKLGMSREYVATIKSKRITPRINTAVKLFGACGYALVAVPLDEIPEQAIVIDELE